MPYLTGVEFAGRIGERAAAALFPGNAAERAALLDEAVEASSGQINAAAQTGGFPIPLDGATLAPSSPVVAASIDALVRKHCAALATDSSLATNDEKASWERAREACEAWLEKLAAGDGLPIEDKEGSSTPILEVIPGPGSITFTVGTLRAARSVMVP